MLPFTRVSTRVMVGGNKMVAAAMRSKKTVSVTLEPRLLERARAAGINLSATLAIALQHEISGSESERWKRENRDAIHKLNRMVEERGLFSDDHRAF